jgi:hypothetical protein
LKQIFLASAALAVSIVGIGAAKADLFTYQLTSYNLQLNGYTGNAATVTVNRADSTHATITFGSLVNTGPGPASYQVLMGDSGIADLNVSGTYSLGTVGEANALSGFTPTFKDNTPGQVDGFGNFNLSLNNKDGFQDSATSISIDLTATGATSWASAAGVLTPNGAGAVAAIHSFECQQPCTSSGSARDTGYVANGGAVDAPEPATLALLGVGLLGLGVTSLHRRR